MAGLRGRRRPRVYDVLEPVIPSAARDLLLRDRLYYVYLLASRSRVLYTGMTNNLARRVCEHRLGEHEGFTKEVPGSSAGAI